MGHTAVRQCGLYINHKLRRKFRSLKKVSLFRYTVKVNVKLSRYRPEQAPGVPGG